MALLLVHAAATWMLVGLIWTIQLVHYPLFAAVGSDGWAVYHRQHVTSITPLVGPLMLAEAATAVWLLFQRPPTVPLWATMVGVALVLVVWLSTALWQVPLHNKLATGPDVELARQLAASNWLRTLTWSLRGLLAAWFVWLATE
jgi:hypothetical protein